MKDKTLLKISLLMAIIGLLSMLYLSDKLELKPITIILISTNMLDQNIKIRGSITNAVNLKKIQILEVQDHTGKIEVVLFDENIKLKKGEYIEVEGKVSKYKNKLQINAELIKLL